MKKSFPVVFAAAFLLLLAGCTKIANNEPGRMAVKITDDPFDINRVESATVTITKVEARKAGAAEGESPFVLLSDQPVTLDLIDLRNGVVEDLVNLEVPKGEYDLVRLYIDEASLTLKDQTTYTVKVPSGSQTGIKIFISPAIKVEGGLTAELLLDFDLSKSFVMRGKPENGFIFKPVIRAVNNSTAGRIEGMVKDTAKVKIVNAKVWVARDTVVATAFTDTLGYYGFIGLPAGTYSIFANKEGYDTVSYSGIQVLEANNTVQDFILPKK